MTHPEVLIQSEIVSALIEALGMLAENMQRQHLGQSMVYQEEAFKELSKRYLISYNDVVAQLQE